MDEFFGVLAKDEVLDREPRYIACLGGEAVASQYST